MRAGSRAVNAWTSRGAWRFEPGRSWVSRGAEALLPGKLVGDVGQARAGAIPLGEHRIRDRPLNPDIGVVPRDPGLRRRVVGTGELVGDVGHVAQHAEAVGEAHRDIQLPVALVVELVPLPLPVGRRVASQIHGDVPDPPPQAADELRLSGRGLKVQPAKDVARGAGVVVLDEVDLDAELAPGVVTESLDEEAALVSMNLRLDQRHAVEPSLKPSSHQPSALPYWRS